MKKRILSMLLAIVMVVGLVPGFTFTASAEGTTDTWDGTSVATAYAGGTGTEADPYQITTAAQLIYLRNQVNDGQSYDGQYFRLDADLDMASKSFGNSIGYINNSSYKSYYFNGHFDGNNHTISNLTITSKYGYTALFGNVGYGTNESVISNLTLSGVKINRTSTGYGAAALVGQAKYMKIENCIIESGTIAGKGGYTAGFVATKASGGTLTITNCINRATITYNGTDASAYTAGICTQAAGSQITGCVNYGNVTSTKGFTAGILANGNSAVIEKCANYGDITNSGSYAAGILASSTNYSIKNCFNQGNVSAVNNSGGITYYLNTSNTDKIENCYNVGTVSITSTPGYNNYCDPITTTSTRSANTDRIINTYALADSGSGAITKTAYEFKNGTVATLLQGTQSETIWGQGLDYPEFFNGTNTIPEPPAAVTGITLSEDNLTLNAGDSTSLTATVTPDDAGNKNISWSSTAPNVATVENGLVKAIAEGNAVITATTEDGGFTATCTVTVQSHHHDWNAYEGKCNKCDSTHYTHTNYEWTNGVCSVCGVTGGYCGYVNQESSVEWMLTSVDSGTTYTLTISGTGKMGEYIDYNDGVDAPWFDYGSKITTVVINNGVKDIGWGAFKHLVNLNSVSIPSSVTEIKRAAFLGASSLTSISLPSSITTIGQSAFKESGLTSISIPSGVTKIQGSTFSGCTKLTSVTLPNSITEIEGNAFQQCSSLSQITLPTGLTTVGEWAFNQSGLTSVTIPSSVTSLGMHAFSGCTNLETVTITGTDLTIATRAFQGDEALVTLTINNTGNVTIGDYAFMIDVAEDDDDNVDIGDVGIGGWTPVNDEQIETQSYIDSRSTVKYTSQSETGEIGKDKLYTITLPNDVKYTTDYATSFKNRVRSVDIGDTATVFVGNSIIAIPAFTSDTAFDKALTWSSDNPGVATVDANGMVTGVSAGSATITATSKYSLNGEPRSDTCVVTVTQHTHEWIYSLDGTDTIKATCKNTDNKCNNLDGGSIKITARNSTYAPNTPNAANLTDANGNDAVVIGGLTELPTIQYQKKSGEEWETATTAAPTDAGTYKASITVGTNTTAEVVYTIAKADAVAPSGLTAVYGQTLTDVTLPDGWSWVDGSTSVGDVGTQTHYANFAGTNNYNAASNVIVVVTVSQSGATMTAAADKTSYAYGDTITITVNIAPTAPQNLLLMAEPTANQIAIFNGATQITEPQTVNGTELTFTVNSKDKGLTVSGSPYTLTAKYIAGNMEGKTANTQAITITQATPTITTLPTADGITYGQTLESSVLTGGAASVAGSFAWAYADTVPTVSGGSTGYEVIFTPNDTVNYTTATVTVTLTVNPKNITGATVGIFAAMTYNGTAQTPSAVVTIGDLTVEGSWSQVTNVTDTTTFTADGNFTGTIEDQNPGMQKLALTDATITFESDSLIYNGSAQSVTITSVKVGDVVVPAVAYSVSGNTGTEVGSYNLTITAEDNTNFTGSATQDFTIARSGSVIGNDSIKVYRGETETTDFTYGDVITVKAQVATTGEAPITFALMPNQMALFYGDVQISEAVDAVDGVYTMTYDTTKKDLPVGTSTLTVKYVGNGNMADTEKSVDVTLNKKPLTVVSAASDGRVYEKNNTAVNITGVTISGKVDTDDVSVDFTNLTGSLASDNAGTYTEVTLPALTLIGDHKDYYIISGGEVDTYVTIAQITGTTSVNASPVTYSDTSAKTQDLADVVALFKNGTEDLTYTVASKGSEIASASMDGSQLTFNLASGLTDAGTAAITVDVTGFANYSKVTVTVNIELTDKTTVTVDMSDIVLVNRDFNGEALTYTGEAKADGYDGAFTYTWQDAEGNALAEAPSDAGTYRLVASVSDTVFYAGSNYVTVTIAPKEVTVTALDKSAYVGSTSPDLSAPVAGKDYTISGLVDDTAVTVTLSCTPDMSKAGEYAITASATATSGNYTFNVVDGKLTVKYYPYIPSVPSTPPATEVTVPISGDDNTIHVDAEVKGDKATVDHVDKDHLDTVIGDHVEEIGTVTIDFSVLDKPITTVEIPANAVKEIADAINNPHNDAHSFEVVLTGGTSIEFDAEAMAEKAAQADGKDITISIVSHEDAKLTSAQEYVVGDHVAFDINVTSGGEHISDMGGKVSVHVPYELAEGEDPDGIVVWYVDEFGNRERCETSYDPIKKRVNFKTDHLSLYMIDYDAALAESCDGVTNCSSKAFTDLDTSLWYHEATDYVLENGLMNGVGNKLFDPNGTTSRAMIVTILWRLEGEPVVNYLMQFEDVAAETWYTEAVRWAASEGIVEGYSNTSFGPNDPITREQLATILYRYEQHKGGGFTGAWMFLLDYTDRDKVSDWAYEAMCWTTMHGVINGKGDGILDPKGDAKRCEAAQMLMNYLNK